MATPRQLAANRLNAQKSTGPRTPEGKARSSQNAVKTGIDANTLVIPGLESQEEFEALKTSYEERLPDPSPAERYLIETLVQSDWTRRRMMRVEAGAWAQSIAESTRWAESMQRPNDNLEARAFLRCDATLDRVQKRLNALNRNYIAAMRQLDARIRERAKIMAKHEPLPELVVMQPSQPAQPAGVSPIQEPLPRREGTNPIPASEPVSSWHPKPGMAAREAIAEAQAKLVSMRETEKETDH